MSQQTSIAIMSRAAEMLAEANTIQAVNEFKNLALTAADWARRKGLGEKAIRHALSYALVAERKMGGMLRETDFDKGGRPTKTPLPGKGVSPSLKELGLTYRESSEAQILASISDTKFEEVKSGKKSKKAAVNEARREKRRAEAKAQPELPEEKKYRIIYADPPWPYDQWLPHQYGDVEKHYPNMSIEALCALPIKDLAEKDAALFLWVTSPKLERAFGVIRAWGFEYKTSFVWDKVKHNFGYYNSMRHEFLLIAGRGQSTPDSKKLVDSVVSIERSSKHSEKPEYFRTLIDKLYPQGTRIELFHRGKVKAGWDTWGNE